MVGMKDAGVKNSWSVRLYVIVKLAPATETIVQPWAFSRASTVAVGKVSNDNEDPVNRLTRHTLQCCDSRGAPFLRVL